MSEGRCAPVAHGSYTSFAPELSFVSGHAFRHADKPVKFNAPSGAGFTARIVSIIE
jgi:hypothetical protein